MSRRRRRVRIIGFIVLGVGAVVVFATSYFGYPRGVDRATLIDAALEDHIVNRADADSAPKQDVVNGWVARDFLEVSARTLNELNAKTSVEIGSGFRLTLLVAIAVLAICWNGLTLPWVLSSSTSPKPESAPAPTPATPVAPPTPQSTFAPPPQPPQPPTGDGAWSAQWPAR